MEKEDARFDRRDKKVVNGVEKVIRSMLIRELDLPRNEKEVRRSKPYSKIECDGESSTQHEKTLMLGVVLKGLPVAYSLARMNSVVENFVPPVAHRPL